MLGSNRSLEGSRTTMNMAMSIVTCGDLDVTVWLHTEQDPDQTLWNQAVKKITDLKKKRPDVSRIRTLAVTDGGAPNSIQRGQLFADVLEGKATSAVVTTILSNPLKRGVATAISWLNPSFRAFQPEDMAGAFNHLQLTEHVDTIIEELVRLQKSLPPVKTLSLMQAQR